jgi:hypothetical protein
MPEECMVKGLVVSRFQVTGYMVQVVAGYQLQGREVGGPKSEARDRGGM